MDSILSWEDGRACRSAVKSESMLENHPLGPSKVMTPARLWNTSDSEFEILLLKYPSDFNLKSCFTSDFLLQRRRRLWSLGVITPTRVTPDMPDCEVIIPCLFSPFNWCRVCYHSKNTFTAESIAYWTDVFGIRRLSRLYNSFTRSLLLAVSRANGKCQ